MLGLKGAWDMRYLTHQFAHSETLDRARRWLVAAGVSPERMHVHRHGVPSLTVAVEAAEVDGIEMVISAAEHSDPDGLPSFWELARLEPALAACAAHVAATSTVSEPLPPFALAWHPVDTMWDEETGEEAELQREYGRIWP
jgi:hypothetical protein